MNDRCNGTGNEETKRRAAFRVKLGDRKWEIRKRKQELYRERKKEKQD